MRNEIWKKALLHNSCRINITNNILSYFLAKSKKSKRKRLN